MIKANSRAARASQFIKQRNKRVIICVTQRRYYGIEIEQRIPRRIPIRSVLLYFDRYFLIKRRNPLGIAPGDENAPGSSFLHSRLCDDKSRCDRLSKTNLQEDFNKIKYLPYDCLNLSREDLVH